MLELPPTSANEVVIVAMLLRLTTKPDNSVLPLKVVLPLKLNSGHMGSLKTVKRHHGTIHAHTKSAHSCAMAQRRIMGQVNGAVAGMEMLATNEYPNAAVPVESDKELSSHSMFSTTPDTNARNKRPLLPPINPVDCNEASSDGPKFRSIRDSAG